MNLFRFFRRRADSNKDVAAQRLRLVLAHDRAQISPGVLALLKDEIIAVITKHLDIDPAVVQVNLTEDHRETRLVADIPLNTRKKSVQRS